MDTSFRTSPMRAFPSRVSAFDQSMKSLPNSRLAKMLWGAQSAISLPLYMNGTPSTAKLRNSIESAAARPGKASTLLQPCAMSWFSRKRKNALPFGNSRAARASA